MRFAGKEKCTDYFINSPSSDSETNRLTARKHIRMAEGERRHNGRKVDRLKSAWEFKTACEIRRRSLGICHACFPRYKIYRANARERRKNNASHSIVPIAADLYDVKFIRKSGKNLTRRGNASDYSNMNIKIL